MSSLGGVWAVGVEEGAGELVEVTTLVWVVVPGVVGVEIRWGGWDDLGFEFGHLVHEELELGFEVGDGFGGFLVHGVG